MPFSNFVSDHKDRKGERGPTYAMPIQVRKMLYRNVLNTVKNRTLFYALATLDGHRSNISYTAAIEVDGKYASESYIANPFDFVYRPQDRDAHFIYSASEFDAIERNTSNVLRLLHRQEGPDLYIRRSFIEGKPCLCIGVRGYEASIAATITPSLIRVFTDLKIYYRVQNFRGGDAISVDTTIIGSITSVDDEGDRKTAEVHYLIDLAYVHNNAVIYTQDSHTRQYLLVTSRTALNEEAKNDLILFFLTERI